MLISVITPSFNSVQFIERAISSVVEQNYPHWEHIVMDGGSTDGTADILKKYPHLQWVSQKDDGQADAMNKGFARAKGDIIVYLNADDYFFPGAFSAVVPAFEAGAFFVVGNVLVKSPRLNAEFLNTPRVTLEGILRHWEPNAYCYNPLGYFYRREVQLAYPFNNDNYATMDLEFLLDAASRYPFSKVEYTLGCFEDGLTTKTHHTQIRHDYWQPSTFPYLEKHVQRLPVVQRERYLAGRRAGYVQKQAESNRRARREGWRPVSSDGSISVVIPAYNCRGVICRTIDSVLSQDIEELEVIVVNDCSSDDTAATVKSCYAHDPRVRLITHAENTRQGIARNTGLSHATGEYVFFLDSDDWIEPDTFLILRSLAKTYDADIVACGIRMVWNNKTTAPYHAHAFACGGGREALGYVNDYYVGTIPWNKLYKRSFLSEHSLTFIGRSVHEDVLFSIMAAFLCKKYISINDVLINYYQHEASSTNRKPEDIHLISYVRMWYDLDKFGDFAHLKDDEWGRAIFKSLLRSHASNDMIPKLRRYVKMTDADKLAGNIDRVCAEVFGARGLAISDALFSLLAPVPQPKEHSPRTAKIRNTLHGYARNLKNILRRT